MSHAKQAIKPLVGYGILCCAVVFESYLCFEWKPKETGLGSWCLNANFNMTLMNYRNYQMS